MSRQIEKDLDKLIEAGVISTDTGDRIRHYYQSTKKESSSRLILVFGILGALLVGLGIILIIAHNWDELSRGVKLLFALLPLLLGQLLCVYALIKRRESMAWTESASVFLFFAIAASISIVSQVYNIPGDFAEFMLTWMLLSLPLLYLMRSAATSLFFIVGITAYAYSDSYFQYPASIAWYYWIMFAAALPFMLRLLTKGAGNFAVVHRWLLCLSVLIALGIFNGSDSDFIWIAYMSTFGAFILIGDLPGIREEPIRNNAFLVCGSVGSVIILLIATFYSFWESIAGAFTFMNEEFYASIVCTALAAALLLYSVKRRSATAIHPNAWLFLIFIVPFAIGTAFPVFIQWLVNALVLGMAVLTTMRGAERNDMFLLNYGLVIMAVLIACRFFDTDMSFVVRGILFVAVGLSFFGVNYWFLKKRSIQNV